MNIDKLRQGEDSSRRLAWWHYGVMGVVVLLLATAIGAIIKIPLQLMRGQEVRWGEIPGFVGLLLLMGFACGITAWIGRLLTSRLGRLGDALTGMLVMDVFFLICMMFFMRESLMRFDSHARIMLALGTAVGLVLGVCIGRDMRKESARNPPA
jgi:hypothetical protein